jgi:DNA-binding transcriptional regulator YiaG
MPFPVAIGANDELEPARHEVIMPKNTIKGIPALLGDARRVLGLNQAQLADLLGTSKRTVQRWETKRADASSQNLATLAAHVHPHDAETAAELAAALGQTLEGLGLVAPPAPPPPPAAPPPARPPGPRPMPRELTVDAVVCVASDAMGIMPAAVRGGLLAAFRRARQLGLSCEEVEQALGGAAKPEPEVSR